MKVLHNDTKILEEISINKQLLIDSTTNYANRINSNENYLLKKYSIIELLTGIKVYENNMTDQSSWFQIFFANIPDHCLDSEWLKSEEMQNRLKNIVAQLSGELQDKYRSMFKVVYFLEPKMVVLDFNFVIFYFIEKKNEQPSG